MGGEGTGPHFSHFSSISCIFPVLAGGLSPSPSAGMPWTHVILRWSHLHPLVSGVGMRSLTSTPSEGGVRSLRG